MQAASGKSFVCSSWCWVLALCFAGVASGKGPVDTNRLETGGNYNIAPPPTNMLFKVTNNESDAGDDDLVWSNSGRMLSVNRTDPSTMLKYICLLDVRNLGNVQTLGARSSSVTNPLSLQTTGWTWNDDRVLFGWEPSQGAPGLFAKCRLMSCAATGPISVKPFLIADPQENPTNHVYSPSVVLDPAINQERLLFLVSSSTNGAHAISDLTDQPAARINLFTVPFDSGGVPNWNDRIQLTDFNTNLSIQCAKWCPELGTNYQPICDRLVILFSGPERLVVLNNVQGIIASSAPKPTNLEDSHFIVVESNLVRSSQVSWTFDGQYVMYGRSETNPAAGPASVDLYSIRADSSTNTAVKFEIPSSLLGGDKQWLSISPDGMKAAFTVDYKAYVIPLQFDNNAVTGAVVTNILTDASYTAVDVPGDAIPSNTTISIVAPPSVDTNNFNGEFSGYAREFSVSGVSSQFDLATNVEMTLHFSQADIPAGASVTNLAIYVYNPQGTNPGQTGTWDKLDSEINTNQQTITCQAEHFSIYAIGRASAQPEPEPVVAPTVLTADFDGDSKADPALYRSASSNWYVKLSSMGYGLVTLSFGGSGYQAVNGDFDGDGKADPAVYLPAVPSAQPMQAGQAATGSWYVQLSGSGYAIATMLAFGGSAYEAVTGDYDGDGLTDPAIYNTTSGDWQVAMSSLGYGIASAEGLGGAYRTAVQGNYDADNRADAAIYNTTNGNWTVLMSAQNYITATLWGFGGTGYTPISGDFDGDGLADPAIYAEATGDWQVKLSASGYATAYLDGFGGTGKQVAAADYDGDGLADPIYLDEATGIWHVQLSASGYAEATTSSGYTP